MRKGTAAAKRKQLQQLRQHHQQLLASDLSLASSPTRLAAALISSAVDLYTT
ncbi:uncharacterized protein Dwil_GK27874 [Drosophila willistoni]|uniref:Uncharacterized protein n=1 Tax=Drosophila willistoni TaxID=7260 RepID=A0A0Q9X5J2_DROWI|nr:uncharacterized protein Dwil_GK27874 [Drosophila willistoni]